VLVWKATKAESLFLSRRPNQSIKKEEFAWVAISGVGRPTVEEPLSQKLDSKSSSKANRLSKISQWVNKFENKHMYIFEK
jgi:hypothetical protein